MRSIGQRELSVASRHPPADRISKAAAGANTATLVEGIPVFAGFDRRGVAALLLLSEFRASRKLRRRAG